MPTGARGVEKGESDMHLYGTKRDRSERVVCCFPLYKLKKKFQLKRAESKDAIRQKTMDNTFELTTKKIWVPLNR